MNTTIIFSRGFAIPKAQFDGLTNPLRVSNLYGGGGRFHLGDEKGVSFSIQVANQETDTSKAIKDGRANAEYYAKVRMANKDGFTPVVVTFPLTEQTFPILQGKLGIPHKLDLGVGEKITQVEPINTFDELRAHQDGEIIVQAGNLSPEQLKQLGVEIGTANIGVEGKRMDLLEAISSKVEFTYKPLEVNNPLGENGSLLK